MASQPLYVGLAAEFVRDIGNGRYPVGSLLPTEFELAAQRKISRSTARAALNYLVSLGLVSRHKGVGTRVEASAPSRGYNPSTTTIEDLIYYDAATDRRVWSIERIVADEDLARKLDGRPGRRWVRISTTRRELGGDAPPMCWTDNYLDDRYAPVAEKIANATGLIVDLVAQAYGVTVEEVRQTIRAVDVPAPVAPYLDCPAGTRALEITRDYRDTLKHAMLISVSIHPADRFEYTSVLRRPHSP